MKTKRQNLALRAYHLKRVAQEVFAEHGGKLARHHEVKDVATYTKFRTAAELGNAERILQKTFAWAKNASPNKTEKSLIEMLTEKVVEYPERNQSAKLIRFSASELELAKTVGKKRLKEVLENVRYIDLIASRYMEQGIKARTRNFAEHFFWHGGAHAIRLLTALIEKI